MSTDKGSAIDRQFGLVCASHTPLLHDRELASADICDTVQHSFAAMGELVESFEADQIIQFSPDHFHAFHYDNMPSFCIGAAAESYGDYGTSTGALQVDEDFALAVLDAVRDADVDLSVSFSMIVDHGFVQIWEASLGAFADLPLIPIFVNAIGYPLPSYRRARQLGEAVGKFAKGTGLRILFAASGGLSHDPVVPKIKGADQALRARLVGRDRSATELQLKREALVREAARAAMEGRGPCRPLNPDWDRRFLALLRNRNWAELDAMSAETVEAAAGAGGNEVLCWIAAMAAFSTAAETPQIIQQDYVAVPGWIAGLAHLSALG